MLCVPRSRPRHSRDWQWLFIYRCCISARTTLAAAAATLILRRWSCRIVLRRLKRCWINWWMDVGILFVYIWSLSDAPLATVGSHDLHYFVLLYVFFTVVFSKPTRFYLGTDIQLNLNRNPILFWTGRHDFHMLLRVEHFLHVWDNSLVLAKIFDKLIELL